METFDQVVRLLLMQMRGVKLETQADAIRELGKAGFRPARIAELLDTTPATVKVTLARAKRGNAKRKKSEGEREG
jgi:DNA-directed RNA polymerase specialized sigma24 family protein